MSKSNIFRAKEIWFMELIFKWKVYREGEVKERKRQNEKKERGRKRRVVEEKKGKIKLFGWKVYEFFVLFLQSFCMFEINWKF